LQAETDQGQSCKLSEAEGVEDAQKMHEALAVLQAGVRKDVESRSVCSSLEKQVRALIHSLGSACKDFKNTS
jgi:hypothetical protein